MPEKNSKERPKIMAMFRGPGPKYALPSVMGRQGHDLTHRCEPAVIMTGRWGSADKPTVGPGPKYAIAPGMDRRGLYQSPQLTMAWRPLPKLEKNLTPSPASYAPEKFPYPKAKSSPKYTMCGRNFRLTKLPPLPAANSYKIEGGMGAEVPNLTTAPKYTMAGRHFEKKNLTSTPGPRDIGQVDLVKPRRPAFTFPSRHGLLKEKFVSPGPNAYRTDLCTYVTHKRPPKAVMGIRHSEYTTTVFLPEDINQ